MSAALQTSLDVPETFPESDLGESHGEELVSGCHSLACSGHRMEIYGALELFTVQQIDNLGEN